MALPDKTQAALACSVPHPAKLIRCGGVLENGAVEEFSEKHMNFIIAEWLPRLLGSGEDDEHWDWRGKAAEPTFPSELQHVVLVHDGSVEGVMLTSFPVSKPSLSNLESVLFVEYLATAPWNRKSLATSDAPQRFKAIGPTLLFHAVNRSIWGGRAGRIGLHSEAKARAFYGDTLKLLLRGSEDGREYFEGDPAWAEAFLTGKR